MQRYFFDVDDGRRQVRDEIGKPFLTRDLATLEAGTLLRTLADIRHIEGRPGTTRVIVRDEYGREVHEVSIDV